MVLASALATVTGAATAQAHAARQVVDGLVFHYGLVPAEIVLAHPDSHAERQLHGGGSRGESHLVLALFDERQKIRLVQAEVTVQISRAEVVVASMPLQPMTIRGQPGFGGFVSVGAAGVYTIRFDVRLPGASSVSTAAFEYRVSPELRP